MKRKLIKTKSSYALSKNASLKTIPGKSRRENP